MLRFITRTWSSWLAAAGLALFVTSSVRRTRRVPQTLTPQDMDHVIDDFQRQVYT